MFISFCSFSSSSKLSTHLVSHFSSVFFWLPFLIFISINIIFLFPIRSVIIFLLFIIYHLSIALFQFHSTILCLLLRVVLLYSLHSSSSKILWRYSPLFIFSLSLSYLAPKNTTHTTIVTPSPLSLTENPIQDLPFRYYLYINLNEFSSLTSW